MRGKYCEEEKCPCDMMEWRIEEIKEKDLLVHYCRENGLEMIGLSSGKIRVQLWCENRYTDVKCDKEGRLGEIG